MHTHIHFQIWPQKPHTHTHISTTPNRPRSPALGRVPKQPGWPGCCCPAELTSSTQPNQPGLKFNLHTRSGGSLGSQQKYRKRPFLPSHPVGVKSTETFVCPTVFFYGLEFAKSSAKFDELSTSFEQPSANYSLLLATLLCEL